MTWSPKKSSWNPELPDVVDPDEVVSYRKSWSYPRSTTLCCWCPSSWSRYSCPSNRCWSSRSRYLVPVEPVLVEPVEVLVPVEPVLVEPVEVPCSSNRCWSSPNCSRSPPSSPRPKGLSSPTAWDPVVAEGVGSVVRRKSVWSSHGRRFGGHRRCRFGSRRRRSFAPPDGSGPTENSAIDIGASESSVGLRLNRSRRNGQQPRVGEAS